MTDKIKDTALESLQLVELAEEVNGNLTLSIGNASLDVSLDKLRRYRDTGEPTDFRALFTNGLKAGGYDDSQCQEFYQKMSDDGYGFRLTISQIDEDTPLTITDKESTPKVEEFTSIAGTTTTIQTAKGKEFYFG